MAEGFQISQKVGFFEDKVGPEFTLKRPISNTRVEPYGDREMCHLDAAIAASFMRVIPWIECER